MAAVEALNGKHGKGTIIRANSHEIIAIERISTGHAGIDDELGGGIPRGRITEIFGWESSGKTTLFLQVVANAQKMGLVAAYIDVEHAVDLQYAAQLGVDVDALLFSQPDSAESAMDIMEVLVRSGEVGVIVIDSVSTMTTQRQRDGDVDKESVGELARLMSRELSKINPSIEKTKTAVLFVNQLREKINAMGYGEKKTTSGGRALRFYAAIRIEVAKVETVWLPINGDKIAVGQINEVKTVKNKTAPPLRKIKVELRYPVNLGTDEEPRIQTPGYDHTCWLIDEAIDRGVIKKEKNTILFTDGSKAVGKENAREHLIANPALAQDIMQKIAS